MSLESFSKPIKKEIPIDKKEELLKNIKEQANYQGNHSLLFFERLENPEFKKKLVDTIYEYEKSKQLNKKEFDFKDGEVYFLNRKEKYKRHKENKGKINKEEIKKELDERIQIAFSDTVIEPNTSVSRAGYASESVVAYLDPECKYSEKEMTVLQKSIVEAHEKGHVIRDFYNPNTLFVKNLMLGFDFSKIRINKYFSSLIEEQLLMYEPGSSHTNKDRIERQIDYFKKPNEIIERMAQLRNYFGMKYGDIFTKEHLDYVRENYSKDTGFYLQIQPFLQTITPETEKKFLELINELPI